MLSFRSFDPKLGKWIQDPDGKPIVETLSDTILEALHPNGDFSFALVDESTTIEDLQTKHPDGHRLLFSTGNRYVFGDTEMQKAMEAIFPNDPANQLFGIKDRGAYGALLLGECKSKEQRIKVLIVDRSGANDETEFSTAIDYAEATAFQIASGTLELDYDELVTFQDNLKDGGTPGIEYMTREQLSEQTGVTINTAASYIQKPLKILIVNDEVDEVNGGCENGDCLPNDVAAKLVGDCHGRISKSISLNYGLKINPRTGISSKMIQFRSVLPNFDSSNEQIETQEIVQGTHKIAKGTLLGQDFDDLPWADRDNIPDLILARSSFKGGMKPPVGLHLDQDIWLGAKSLSSNGKMSISSLINLYPGLVRDVLPVLSAKEANLAAIQNDPLSLARMYIESSDGKKVLSGTENGESNEDTGKEDSNELKLIRAAVKSRNVAALQLQPVADSLIEYVQGEWQSYALGGDKSIAFDRAMALPDRKLKNGEICVPWMEEGAEVIAYRPPLINTNGVHILINKKEGNLSYERNSQFIGISDENPLSNSVLGDFALDFDGDYIAIARVDDYPNLARDVREKQLEENRYPAIIKEKKQEFGINVTQEEASLQMSRAPVGLVANALIALQSEIGAIKLIQGSNSGWVLNADRELFAAEVKSNIREQLSKLSAERPFLVRQPNNLSLEGIESFRFSSKKIEALANNIMDDKFDASSVLSNYKELLRELVGLTSGQYQIAVDMFKSSRVADDKATRNCTKFLAHRSTIQKEKKLPGMYEYRCLAVNGVSAGEVLASSANLYFQENRLSKALPMQFNGLFSGVEYDPIQMAIVNGFRDDFQKIWIEASDRKRKETNETGASMQLNTPDGKSIDVVNLHRGESEVSYSPEMITQVSFRPASNRRAYHSYEIMDAGGKKIGDLCQLSAAKIKADGFKNLSVVSGHLKSRQEFSNVYFTKARELAAEFVAKIPAGEKVSYAAAMWAQITSDNTSRGQQTIQRAALITFSDEIANQIATTDMGQAQVKLQEPIKQSDELQAFKIIATSDGKKVQTQLYSETDNPLGYITQAGYPVPAGELRGRLLPGTPGVLQVEIAGMKPLTIGKINDFALANKSVDTMSDVEISIKPTTVDLLRLAIGGKAISDSLSSNATAYIKAKNLDDGKPFTASVVSRKIEGAKDRSSLYLRFDSGEMIECVGVDASLPAYAGEKVDLSIVSSPKYTAGVFIEDESGSRQIGEFTTGQRKASETALLPAESLNLLVASKILNGNVNYKGVVDRSKPLSGSFQTKATIRTDGTNQVLTIISQDLNPPRSQLKPQPAKDISSPLIDRLRAYKSQFSPVLLARGEQSLLAVDSSVAKATEEWLKKAGVAVTTGERDDRKRHAILRIDATTLPEEVLKSMQQQGMVKLTSDPTIYERLTSKVAVAQKTIVGIVGGVNISRTSRDLVGQRIATVLSENYAPGKPLIDMAKEALEKSPDLRKAITENGGSEWLERCQHRGRADLSGRGKESSLISALIEAHNSINGMVTNIEVTFLDANNLSDDGLDAKAQLQIDLAEAVDSIPLEQEEEDISDFAITH